MLKKVFCFVIAIIALLVSVVSLSGCEMKSSKNQEIYEKAKQAMEDYEYADAIGLLNQIPDYQDARDKLKEAKNGEEQAKFATYIFKYVKDGGFYNPAAVRVLSASYGDSKDFYARTFNADGILYLKLQGTNKIGGTINREYVIVIGGAKDGEVYTNDDSEKDYSKTDREVDVPTINKMLIKYWKDYGIG